jgi:hypothetical protein
MMKLKSVAFQARNALYRTKGEINNGRGLDCRYHKKRRNLAAAVPAAARCRTFRAEDGAAPTPEASHNQGAAR